ncbi:MAG: FAD-binding protein [Eggerthella lenta]
MQDDAGKVTGAIFEADGGYVQVNAAKGVLLTTGGYTSNAEMLRACNRWSTAASRCSTVRRTTWRGIKAGIWAGAQRTASARR